VVNNFPQLSQEQQKNMGEKLKKKLESLRQKRLDKISNGAPFPDELSQEQQKVLGKKLEKTLEKQKSQKNNITLGQRIENKLKKLKGGKTRKKKSQKGGAEILTDYPEEMNQVFDLLTDGFKQVLQKIEEDGTNLTIPVKTNVNELQQENKNNLIYKTFLNQIQLLLQPKRLDSVYKVLLNKINPLLRPKDTEVLSNQVQQVLNQNNDTLSPVYETILNQIKQILERDVIDQLKTFKLKVTAVAGVNYLSRNIWMRHCQST
jgi:phosphoribosyl-ATP pyrophosphohydrolase